MPSTHHRAEVSKSLATSFDAQGLIKIGTLKKPYGVQGWLWVFSDTEDREAIFAMQPWVIQTALGQRTLTVKNWHAQGKGYVVQLNEIPDRNLAETYYGVTLWAAKADLAPLGEDEHYWADLIGLSVISQPDSVKLGQIKDLFETGAHDVMVVKPTPDSVDEQERLIPWHKQTVLAVDLAAKTVTVDWAQDY